MKKIWEKLYKVRCILVLIMDINTPISNDIIEYKDDIIIYQPIENVHNVFTAQHIKLLFPSILEKYICRKINDNDIIMIADIDSIPLNNDFFKNIINTRNITDFIHFTDNDTCYEKKEYELRYCSASKEVWKKIFNIKTEKDVNNLIIKWYNEVDEYIFDAQYKSKCRGYKNAQKILYNYVNDYLYNDINFINIDYNELKTLDPYKIYPNYKVRENYTQLLKKIKLKEYNTYNNFIPFGRYERLSGKIYNQIINN